jgi:hypothetical protein
MELIGREALQQQQPAVSFKQEICAMMYVFGDVPRPNQAAAELIEAVIHKHMTKIVSDFTHSCTGGVGRMYWV